MHIPNWGYSIIKALNILSTKGISSAWTQFLLNISSPPLWSVQMTRKHSVFVTMREHVVTSSLWLLRDVWAVYSSVLCWAGSLNVREGDQRNPVSAEKAASSSRSTKGLQASSVRRQRQQDGEMNEWESGTCEAASWFLWNQVSLKAHVNTRALFLTVVYGFK